MTMKQNKIILLGDIHIGASGDSSAVTLNQLKFIDEVLEYAKKHKIKTILQLGDIFDRRKNTNHQTLKLWRDRFFDRMQEMKIEFLSLVGNHDTYYNNTLEVNSPELLLGSYKNVTIYSSPTEIEINGTSCLVLPWICLDNEPKSAELMQTSGAKFAVGHLELAGFEMNKGVKCDHGMDKALFKRFDKVFTGHYHTQSCVGNIHYVGCPFDLTWADYADPKGFHVLDLSSLKTEFVENFHTMHNKIEYDDKDKSKSYWKSFDLSKLSGKFLKLIVINKTDPDQFEKLVDAIYQSDPEDFKIVEESIDLSASNTEVKHVRADDTIGLIESYIDSSDVDVDKDGLKSYMKSLYVVAMEGM